MAESKTLVVDDEPGLRTLYCMLLSNKGFETVQAQNCEQGLESYKADRREDRNIGLVVSDYDTKTGMNGLDFYRRVIEMNPAAYFFLVTAYSPQLAQELAAENQGRFRCFDKPFDFEKFLAAVREALGPQES